ncbi:hypothetical protein EV426DRAFT_713965 [Tirmania nivea]|nr:hypothetical protein EV426DRAFT_713965 [Tirmania nivea]
MDEIPQIARCSQPDGHNRSHGLQMDVDNTVAKHIAAVSAFQNPLSATQELVTAQINTNGPKEEGDGKSPILEEDEIDLWLKLTPQARAALPEVCPHVYKEIEQRLREREKRDPGSIISASSTALGSNASYEEQERGPITDQTGTVGVKPGLPAQGLSNHSQIKPPTIATMGNDRESLYEFPTIREDTFTSMAAPQGTDTFTDTAAPQDTKSYRPYNPSNSLDRGSSQTGIETHPSRGDGRFCSHDPDSQEARVSLQYPGPGENIPPERPFDVGQIKDPTQVIYKCRSPKCEAPNCQEYHLADRDNTLLAVDSQHPLGSVSQGYYNTIINNGTSLSNSQAVANRALDPVQSYPSLKGKQLEPEQPYKRAPKVAPPNPVHQHWAQYRKAASSNNQASVTLDQQDIDEIAGLRANLRQGGHLQNCYLDKPGMGTDPGHPMICQDCWKKLDAAEGLMMFWKKPVVHSHQARAIARVTPRVLPSAQVASQAGLGGKGKGPAAPKASVSRKAEPKSRGSGSRSRGGKNIDQARPHKQEVDGQRIEPEHVSFQQLLPEVNVEQGRIGLAEETKNSP